MNYTLFVTSMRKDEGSRRILLSHFVYIISQKVYLSKDPVFKAVPVFPKIVRIEGRWE